MPHLQTASIGVWVGSGSRDEQPEEHGISHLLEHMAFKGTERRSARQIAEEIEAVGGDINAATSFETTAYFASVLKADMPLAIDVLSDILSKPDLRSGRAQARAERDRAGDRRDRGRARRSGVRLSAVELRSPTSRWAARSSARRETVCSFKDKNLRAYLSRNYRAPDMVVAADRRGRARRGGGRGRAAVRPFQRPGGAAAAAGQVRRRRQARSARSRAGAYRARARRAAAARSRAVQPAGVRRSCWAAACRRGCSRRSARSAASATRSRRSMRPMPTPACSASTPAPMRATCKELMRVVVDETAAAAANHHRGRSQPRQGADQGRAADGAGKLRRPRRQLASQILTYGRPLPIEEMVARIDSVTVESARAAGSALIARGRPAIAALGPGKGLESAATIVESFKRRAA